MLQVADDLAEARHIRESERRAKRERAHKLRREEAQAQRLKALQAVRSDFRNGWYFPYLPQRGRHHHDVERRIPGPPASRHSGRTETPAPTKSVKFVLPD